ISCPFAVVRFRNFGFARWNVCPMLTPLGALTNPFSQKFDFFGRQRVFLVRHSFLGIRRFEPTDHLAFFRMARNDGQLARLGSVECILPEKKTESTVALYAAVAGDAVLVQDGFDLRIEINSILSACTQAKEQ